MDSPDRSRTSDIARREQHLRRELETQARNARRSVADSASRLRASLDREADAARRTASASSRAMTSAGGQSREPTQWNDLDDKLLIWILPLAAIAAIPLAAGHLAAFLVHGSAPSYAVSEAPGIVGRLVADPGDPTAAWAPVNTGAEVPGAGAYWGTFAFVVLILGLVSLLVWAAVRPPAAGSSGWGKLDRQRGLWLGRKDEGRLVLAEAGGHRLAVRDRHSVLVIGPAHSGKTTAVSVPAVLEWQGPAVIASTKGHLIDDTIGWRSHQGDVHVYDPAGVSPYQRSGWSLLADCGTWSGAIRAAADLTLAARAASAPDLAVGGGDAWHSSLSMSLAPYLLAAVASGRSMSGIVEWIEREEQDQVLDVLKGVDESAARAHRRSFSRPDELRSRFLHAMHDILSVYEDPIVASSMDRHDIEAAELLDGGANTLYLTAPEYDRARFRPLCAMIVRRLIATAYEISARTAAPLDPPLLVVLDDVAGIAPIYDLAALASTAPARGVQLVSVFQHRRQITEQVGDDGGPLVRNHGVRLVLREGQVSPDDDPIVDPTLLRDLTDGEAAFVDGVNDPLRVHLRPWYNSRELRRRAEIAQDLVRPAADDAPRLPVAASEQSAAWLRRTSPRPRPTVTDPTIPLDVHDPSYVAVFGELDDDTTPVNVTPLMPDGKRRR